MGYIIAYVLAGVLVDTVVKIIETGETRGIEFLLILAGLGLVITSLIVYKSNSIREMETQKVAEGSLEEEQ